MVDGVGRRLAGAAGCRRVSAVKVEWSGTVRLSSKHSSRTVPFTLPSSSFADAIYATTWSHVLDDLVLRRVAQRIRSSAKFILTYLLHN